MSALAPRGGHSFIYGPCEPTIEQINNSTGAVSYLHHDQQGSTRLLTASTGTVTGKCSYSAYGTPTCEGTATTPLGWDGQYTSADTGLIYMRAREYDPATAQFLTVDPAVVLTREPYVYGGDNPLTYRDRSGLGLEEVLEGGSGIPCPWCEAKEGVEEAIEGAYHSARHTVEKVWNAANENEVPSDEGEAELREKEAQRECGERNPAQDKKLSPGQIKKLKEAGYDPHELNEVDPTGLLFGIELPSPTEAAEAVAGWGDKLTLGATKWAREQLGDENVNTCSAAYQTGGYAGLATAALIPGDDEAEIGDEALNLETTITTRQGLGADGATSQMLRESLDGETISVTHRVELDGDVIHQHQTHVGSAGTTRNFPDEWIEYPTIE